MIVIADTWVYLAGLARVMKVEQPGPLGHCEQHWLHDWLVARGVRQNGATFLELLR